MSKLVPIVGKFRKRVARDIVSSLAVGSVAAYCFWYGYHVPKFQEYDRFFKTTQEEVAAQNEAYKKSLGL